MLSKQCKFNLRNNKKFFSTCRKKHYSFISFFYKKNKKEGFKLIVITPKKMVKLAVNRNEIKRKIYFLIEEKIKNKSNNILNKNINLVIIINSLWKSSLLENSKELDLKLIKIIESGLIEISI